MPILRKMTEEEFRVWAPLSQKAYAEDTARAKGYTQREAELIADESFAKLLPQGIDSKDHFFYVLDLGGESLGTFWFSLQGTVKKRKAFIYDVKIQESHQGKGYGRVIMQLGEQKAKEVGASAIALHVFGFNDRAIKLYQSLKYVTTDLSMEKGL